ncbi:helix-turn-helix domain-containing protein [Limosilactobacillus equigenerosi]|uniref:Insertion element IS150 protein InsJ-like helix-turn-helix domain-containing protein n=1 Tax=Limosilactobacillus equigenerosi DSM 18793 = JCM 14505 TaxID=1423742 RepID=A0A0R1UG66_9LACO|nr:helix-turn-helix domain-containing protein [Limosilactobacillus equigenerosi]KRL91860.1 hypothetical protein FC21_GL000630 [Limosilactobacillus equigenerosi DSM 18793 = JCM 14505]
MAKGVYKEWLKPEKLVLLQGWKRNGLTDEEIAKNIGISRKTLSEWKSKYRNIGDALKIGKQQANFIVENKLFKRAKDGNVTAMIFWLKNNWRDKYNDSTLGPEEVALMKERKRKAKAEAIIAEYQAEQITNSSSNVTGVTIVDDIPKEEGADDDNDKS